MRLFGNRKVNTNTDYPAFDFWRWQDVERDGQEYLTRLVVFRTPWLSCYLHHIKTPDIDPDLHDHPWSFFGILLTGGYWEIFSQRPWEKKGEIRKVTMFNFKNATSAHKIDQVKPNTRTLIFTGPRKKDWGFYDRNTLEFKQWREYLESKKV